MGTCTLTEISDRESLVLSGSIVRIGTKLVQRSEGTVVLCHNVSQPYDIPGCDGRHYGIGIQKRQVPPFKSLELARTYSDCT